MKKFVKHVCMLLALVMVLSLVPVTALAARNDGGAGSASAQSTLTISAILYTDTSMKTCLGTYATYKLKADDDSDSITVDGNTFGQYLYISGRIYEYAGIFLDNELPGTVTVGYGDHTLQAVYVPHHHSYVTAHNRTHHWEGCRCGSRLNVETHVDPAKDEDSICTCGYKFSDNADLVTLWLADMVLDPRFANDITEYNAAVFTYKSVESTSISYRTFDAMATVELPKDLSISEGINAFEITVTAEDRKTTKTYTVYANLATKADGIMVSSVRSEDGILTTAALQTLDRNCIAKLTVSESLAKGLVSQASASGSTRIVLEPSFNKWSTTTLETTIPAAVLEALAETKADFVIKSFLGSIVVPNAELKTLAGEGETLLFTLAKGETDATLTITADGNEVSNAKITLEASEA